MLCVTFTACNPVPEMRAYHATWNEDSSISYNGKTYVKLPRCDNFSPLYGPPYPSVWVTDADVPVLLSESMGTPFYLSVNGDFLLQRGDDSNIYCVSELYDATVKRIEDGDPMLYYCFEKTIYNPETGEHEGKRILLSEDVTKILQKTLSQKPLDLPSGAGISYDKVVRIHRCSEDTLFYSYSSFEIQYNASSETFYLVVDGSQPQSYYLIEAKYLSLMKETFLTD